MDFETQKEILKEIKEMAKLRLEHSGVPFYEKKRLESLINPISIEEAYNLANEIPGITNYIIYGNGKDFKKLIEQGHIEIDFDEFDEEDNELYKNYINLKDNEYLIFGINNEKGLIWHIFCEANRILNSNVIRFYI